MIKNVMKNEIKVICPEMERWAAQNIIRKRVDPVQFHKILLSVYGAVFSSIGPIKRYIEVQKHD